MPIELPRRHFGSDRSPRGLKLPTSGDVPVVRPVGDPGVRVPAPVRSGLEAFGFGVGELGDEVAKAAERQRKEYEATKTAEAEMEADRRFGDEFRRRQTEDDTSRPGFMDDFDTWMKQDRGQLLATVPADVRTPAKERLRIRLEEKTVAMRDAAGRLSLDASAKRAQDAIGKMVNQWAAQAERDPDFADAILEKADERLADFKGALDTNAERDTRAAARETVIKQALIGMARKERLRDAETILDSGKYDADLKSEAKAQVRAVIESERKERLRLAEKAERDAEKRMGLDADQQLKDYYATTETGGVPTLAQVEALRTHPGVKPAEYKGALKVLQGGGPEHDNKDVLANLMPRMHNEDLTNELTNAVRGNQIKAETYTSLMTRNRAALADDRPASPYKSGRSFVSDGLDPGQLGANPFVRAALKTAQTDALVEFDNWARANERMTPEQSIEKAREIRARYQNVAFDQMSLALPRPRGYAGPKETVSPEHLAAARREIANLLRAGTISEAEAAREADQLNVWENVIAQRTPPKAAGR